MDYDGSYALPQPPMLKVARDPCAAGGKRDYFNVVEYLQQPLGVDALKVLATKLDVGIRDFMRSGEADYQELNLADPSIGDDELLVAMAAHPILMQRPIVVSGDQARIGRPPEAVLEIV